MQASAVRLAHHQVPLEVLAQPWLCTCLAAWALLTGSSELQAHAEWAATLELCHPEERKLILQLALPSCGIDMLDLESGLGRYLEPYVITEQAYGKELSWLLAPQHRELLQVMHLVRYNEFLCASCRPLLLCYSGSKAPLSCSPTTCILHLNLQQPAMHLHQWLCACSTPTACQGSCSLPAGHRQQRRLPADPHPNSPWRRKPHAA